MFSKNSRYIKAIKAFIIDGENKKQKLLNFKKAKDENDFYLFPYINYDYEFCIEKEKYVLTIKDNDIDINAQFFYDKNHIIYLEYNKDNYYFDEFKLNNNKIWQIYLLNNNIFMILYKIEIEIDGFFICIQDLELTQFEAKKYLICDNKIEKATSIKKDSYIIFEVKSRKDFHSLATQIVKDYYFFTKYCKVFPKYEIDKFMF